MPAVAYRSWSLIPVDREPHLGRPTVARPPLMATMALDAGASLCFDLRDPPPKVLVKVTTTILSAESRPEGFLRLYRGGPEGALEPVAATWARSQDGMHAVFSASLQPAAPCVKIHFPHGPTLVVAKVEFQG